METIFRSTCIGISRISQKPTSELPLRHLTLLRFGGLLHTLLAYHKTWAKTLDPKGSPK